MSADSRLKKIELEVKPKEGIAVFMQELINYPDIEPRYFYNVYGDYFPRDQLLTEQEVDQFAETFNGEQVVRVIYTNDWKGQRRELTD